MTDTIVDLRCIAESQPSLCIPRVFNNIDEKRIRRVFDGLQLGKIQRIDIIQRNNENGEKFKRVFVHFDKWNWNEDAQAVRRKLISGKEIKIVYDNPWFWKVSANRNPSNDRRNEKSNQSSSHSLGHYIDLGENVKETSAVQGSVDKREKMIEQRNKEHNYVSVQQINPPKREIPVLQKKMYTPEVSFGKREFEEGEEE
jgi:hypothetical protein